MGNTTRLATWAALGLFVAGLFLVLLLLLAEDARAPSVRPGPAAGGAEMQPAPRSEDAPADAAEPQVSPAAIAPPELVATADELQAAYESRKGELPEAMAKPIDADIGVIEGAVADLIAAIAEEPNNDSLKRMLIATYRNEVKLLKRALHLTTATTEDEEETAAGN